MKNRPHAEDGEKENSPVHSARTGSWEQFETGDWCSLEAWSQSRDPELSYVAHNMLPSAHIQRYGTITETQTHIEMHNFRKENQHICFIKYQ